jgi:S-adenosyl methyltransferase
MAADDANVARTYDFLVGGQHHFAQDRELGRKIIEAAPEVKSIVAENRAFIKRSVRYLVNVGIRQFIDVGCGIPAFQNVHQIARRGSPDARVVYVDSDPVVVASFRHLLADDPLAAAVHADLRDPESVLGHPSVTQLIDTSEPVGLLLVNVLAFVPDSGEPQRSISALTSRLAPGSYLAITHSTHDASTQTAASVGAIWADSKVQAQARPAPEILRFFSGFELVEPGLVFMQQWRPEGEPPEHPERVWFYAGVGRKRDEPGSSER